MTVDLRRGDCLVVMRGLPDASVDSVVTDPPYGLRFMGARWDCDVPRAEIWTEILRILKPGGHLLAFAGTRTQHRMCCRIEDAGFEIRDMIAWVYGSGFPKSLNLEGEWAGWGTALKPSLEPITVARKPLVGTVAENVQAHGTGALNIDGCRIEAPEGAVRKMRHFDTGAKSGYCGGLHGGVTGEPNTKGRWPANLIHDGSDEVVSLFPTKAGACARVTGAESSSPTKNTYGARARIGSTFHGDMGSAARFFYCAKASREDRDDGLEHLARQVTTDGRDVPIDNPYLRGETERHNTHPTVKPTGLMRHLCRLVTPPPRACAGPLYG